MSNLIQRGVALRELLRERILIMDGAMGTMLQQANLTAEDFGGPHLEGCNENLVLTRPDVVLESTANICKQDRTSSRRIRLAARR
jgi:methionine synthase I (cobalamin-dependent)